jgi:diguanylate cyclase (GGDEF)-like protein
VANLKAEVSTYETKLKSAESLALNDELTKVANRRSIEERIRSNMKLGHDFCVAVIDLNGFKQVNDNHGHLAGDELLKKFATELKHRSRSNDLVGRWGGDEFLVILSGNLRSAIAHIECVEQWIFGKYTINEANKKRIVIELNGAVGVAQWRRGQSMEGLIAEADSKMYLDKKLAPRTLASPAALPDQVTPSLSGAAAVSVRPR